MKPEEWLVPVPRNIYRASVFDRYLSKVTCNSPNWDIVGEAAASLAAASIVFRTSDYQYHVKLLKHAEELYRFVNNCHGLYFEWLRDKGLPSDTEKVTWPAAWLYRATNQTKYYLEAKNLIKTFGVSLDERNIEIRSRSGAIQILLAQITKEKQYLDLVERFCNNHIRNHTKTPKGLLYIPGSHGALPSVATLAFLCLQVILRSFISI